MESTPDETFISRQVETLTKFTDLMNNFEDKMEVVKIDGVSEGYIIYNAFSETECRFLIDNLEYNQNVEFVNVDTGNVYRKNLRCKIFHKKLAEKIFERIKKFLPQNLSYDHDIKEMGPFSKGQWLLSHINEKFRICKYLNEGFFGVHYDGCFIRDKDERSFFTMMFYLNDNYEGGETVFLDSSEDKKNPKTIVAVKPKRGMMIFFPQDILHEGRAVVGEKYIFRNDIIFKRDFQKETEMGINTELDPKKQALNFFHLAQELERSKQGKTAVEYYKKAFKLDPELEKANHNEFI